MYRILVTAVLIFLSTVFSQAQTASPSSDLQDILQANKTSIERASRKTLDPVLEMLIQSKLDGVQTLLENWRQKKLWLNKSDGQFYYVKSERDNPLQLVDISSQEIVGTADKSSVKQLKPNSGVRSVIAATLVRFQLIGSDPVKRQRAKLH